MLYNIVYGTGSFITFAYRDLLEKVNETLKDSGAKLVGLPTLKWDKQYEEWVAAQLIVMPSVTIVPLSPA